jgi:hypothetical protein
MLKFLNASESDLTFKQIVDHNQNKNAILLELLLSSSSDIYGIQFDLSYNQNELLINKELIVSNIPDINLYSKILNDGKARVLMFSLKGKKIIDKFEDDNLNIINFTIEPVNMFQGISDIEINNIILAGKGGEEILVLNKIINVTFTTPKTTMLLDSYPNPFLILTKIKYQTSDAGIVSLKIYDENDYLIKVLLNEYQKPNYHEIEWDGFNKDNKEAPSGKYTIKMSLNKYSSSRVIKKQSN